MLPKDIKLRLEKGNGITSDRIVDQNDEVVAQYNENCHIWITQNPLSLDYNEVTPDDIPKNLTNGRPVISDKQFQYMCDYVRLLYFGTYTFGNPKQNGYSDIEAKRAFELSQETYKKMPEYVKKILGQNAKEITPEITNVCRALTGHDNINFSHAIILTFGGIERMPELEKPPLPEKEEAKDDFSDLGRG